MDYKTITSDFCDKYCGFYKGKTIDEELTQNFWHSLRLSRNRLSGLGVEQDISVVENGLSEPGQTNVVRKLSCEKGNGRKTTIVDTPVSIRRRFYKNGKKMAEIIDYTAEAICLVLEKDEETTEEEVREIVCPTCGGIGSRISLFDGCDYCGAKFQVDSEERKVSAFAIFHDNIAGTAQSLKNNARLMLLCIVMLAICAGVSTQSFILKDTLVLSVALSKLAKILGYIIFANTILLLLIRQWAKKNKTERLEHTKALENLMASDSSFHFAKFTEELEYKLKSIHFAQKREDIQMFADASVADNISLYSNVLDCQMKNCKVADYRQDELYHHIQVNVQAVLTILKRNKIIEKEETLELSLHKSKAVVPSKSLVSYSCNSCGSSVDLLNGGICEYCGKQLKLENYDWIIDTYLCSQIKRKDEVRFYTKLFAVGITLLILILNITNLRVAIAAASRGFEDMNASVYTYKNEMIPSLGNYGYAFYQTSSEKNDSGVEYHYRYVDSREHIFVDYPDHLVAENGFVIVSSSDDAVILRREKEFSEGMLYISIEKGTENEYIISIRESK